jgi:hypothetical protein
VKLLYTEYNSRSARSHCHTNTPTAKFQKSKEGPQPLVGGVGHQLSELVPWPARVSLALLR